MCVGKLRFSAFQRIPRMLCISITFCFIVNSVKTFPVQLTVFTIRPPISSQDCLICRKNSFHEIFIYIFWNTFFSLNYYVNFTKKQMPFFYSHLGSFGGWLKYYPLHYQISLYVKKCHKTLSRFLWLHKKL